MRELGVGRCLKKQGGRPQAALLVDVFRFFNPCKEVNPCSVLIFC